MEVIHEQLVLALESTAEWRDRKAEEYPEDGRNPEAAIQLRALAEAMGKVEPDHPLLLELAGFWQHKKYEDSALGFIERETTLLREIGFHQSFDTAEAFLGALIQELREEVH